jgi:hypothetical protein
MAQQQPDAGAQQVAPGAGVAVVAMRARSGVQPAPSVAQGASPPW